MMPDFIWLIAAVVSVSGAVASLALAVSTRKANRLRDGRIVEQMGEIITLSDTVDEMREMGREAAVDVGKWKHLATGGWATLHDAQELSGLSRARLRSQMRQSGHPFTLVGNTYIGLKVEVEEWAAALRERDAQGALIGMKEAWERNRNARLARQELGARDSKPEKGKR